MATPELRLLRYFVAVAEELNFTRAAERLLLAQPSLSAQISQLEREIGHPLLTRTTRVVSLTPAGEVLLTQARTLLAQADHLVEITRATGDQLAGSLRIGVESDLPDESLVNLRRFALEHPDVQVHIQRAHEDQLQIDLVENRLQAMVAWLPPSNTQSLRAATIATATLLAVLTPELAERQGAAITLKSFTEHPLVIWRPDVASYAFEYWTSILRPPSTPTQHIVPVQTLDAAEPSMVAGVAAGQGVTFTTETHWAQTRPPGVVALPFDPPIQVPIFLTWRADAETTNIDALRQFLEERPLLPDKTSRPAPTLD